MHLRYATQVTPHPTLYEAEPADGLLIEPLDAMTLIYHRRSGVTHMVAEPVPEMLQVMAGDSIDAGEVLTRLAATFDLDESDDALASVTARLEELAELGLVHRIAVHA
jgi:PqqD family protein of HPr-rel-A system